MENIQNFLNNQKIENEFDITNSVNADIGDLNSLDDIDCPVCKNKGYIMVDDDNGITQSCMPCKCMHKRRVKRLSQESGLGELLKHRVKNYITGNELQKTIKDKAVKFVRNNNQHWFCMLGQSGSGKTHICSAICNALMEQYKDTRYMVWNDFVTFYKDNMMESSSHAAMNDYQKAEVLYIDDLFKGSVTDYDVKNLAFDLINYRYNNRLTTIISSERSFAQLCELDEAIAYRIAEMCQEYLIKIPKTSVNNYRLKKSKQAGG